MGMYGVSSVNANMVYAVSAIHFRHNNLSEELIKKLKQLGIDPSTVKTESEAYVLIKQAENQKKTDKTDYIKQEPQKVSTNVDIKKLKEDIKKMGDKLGIDVTIIEDSKEIVDIFDALIKEYIAAESAQSNKNAVPFIEKNNNTNPVKISTGAVIVDKPDVIQADFKSIKDRVYEVERAKDALFAGQDMLAMMNRMALGI